MVLAQKSATPDTNVESRQDIVLIIRELVPYWEEAIDALAIAWERKGKVTVISGGGGSDELHPWDSPQGNMTRATLITIPPRNSSLLKTVWPSSKMWKVLSELDPQIVIIHEYSPFVLLSGLVWAKSSNRPCVLTSDVGPVQRRLLSISQRLVHEIVNTAVDAVLARTQDAFNQSLISQKTGLLSPHAIDTRFYRRKATPPRIPKRLVQVGSLIPRKGVDLLLRAFALAKRKREDIELVLIGAGDHEGARRLATELAVSDSVQIFGFLNPDDLVEQYRRSDAFVLASRFDSYGVVVHEAAAAGLPLVVSKFAGASATLVEAGRNGYQIDPHDEAEFSSALLNVLDPDLNERFSSESRKISEQFDLVTVATQTATWLSQLLSARPTQTPSNRRPSYGRGVLRFVGSVIVSRFSQFAEIFERDAFSANHREIVFLNRYIPFYRGGIFRKMDQWRSTILLYSGKSLGNLKSADGVESAVVRSFDKASAGGRKIVWLGSTIKLLQIRPKIVLTEMSLSLLSTWCLFALRPFLGFRLIFWTHGFQNFGWGRRGVDLGDFVRLQWMRWSDSVLFYSEGRKADVTAIMGPCAKFFVAPNTLDTSVYDQVFHALKTRMREDILREAGMTSPSMIYVGRLSAEKEVLRLVDVLGLTDGCKRPPSLHIVGGGEEEAELRSCCAKFGNRVVFHGPIFDAEKLGVLIYCSDLMLCSGYVGLNVVDSLAMGCPFATMNDRYLIKRHSPEVRYLYEGENAIFADGVRDLAQRLIDFFEGTFQFSLDRSEIRDRFRSDCSLSRQFEGMRNACLFALGEKSL